jgi:hypothetical protein
MAATTPRHGRFGVLYLSAANGGTATTFPNLESWTLDGTTEFDDVTCMGDSNHSYVAGIPDVSGSFNAVWDSATASVFFAAGADGLSRRMYLYPGGSSANYWYGDILLDSSFDGGIDGAVRVTANWKASGAITKQGTI